MSFSAELLSQDRPGPVPLQGVSPSQVQDFSHVLVEFHEVSVTPFLQPVYVPLNENSDLESADGIPQFSAFCKPDEVVLCVLLQATDKDTQWRKSKGKLPRSTPGNQLSGGV